MNGDTTITVSLLISLASIIFVALNFYRGAKKDSQSIKKEIDNDLIKTIEEKVKTNMKLDQLCNTTNDIRTDQKAQTSILNDMDKRLVLVEQSCSTLHNRVDNIDETLGLKKSTDN